MLREQMDRPQLHDMIDLYRELTATKYCSHPVRSGCEGQIVKAHTVPKSGSLRRIAEGGHVYQFRADLPLLKRTHGKPTEKLIGINEASTFTGFCSRHDSKLFEPIEAHPFKPIPQHAQSVGHQAKIRERANMGTFFTNLPPQYCLVDDGLHFVQWDNIEIASNVI